MNESDLIYPWQQAQWSQVAAACHQKRLPQAWLLLGSRGLGKMDFAKKLAGLILCRDNSRDVMCGACRSCQLFRAGSHPDLCVVAPEEKSKTIKVHQIREVSVALHQTAHEGGYQVAIVYPAEAMNDAAASAFLKTLEEPAGRVVFILVSHRWGSLLSTVVSRCQRLVFSAVGDDATVQWLQRQIDGDREKALQLLRLAYYAPFQAVELASTDFLNLRDRLLKGVLASIDLSDNAVHLVSLILKESPQKLIQGLMSILMDVLRLQCGGMDFIANTDRLAELHRIQAMLPREKTVALVQQLQQAWQLIESFIAVNVQLLLEGIFLTLEANDVG